MAWMERAASVLRRAISCLVAVGMLLAAGDAAAERAHRLNEDGVRLAAAGRLPEAGAAFEEALRLRPGDPLIRRNYARLHTTLGHRWLAGGQVDRARAAYEAALDLSAEEVSALLGLGDVALRLRDVRAAAEHYRRAVALDPGSPVGYARLGEALFQLGDADAALAEWGRALTLDPGDSRLRDRVGRVEREVRVAGGYRSRESQHFRVVYEGKRREDVGRALLAILERAYVDIGYELGAYPPTAVETIFYGDRDFVEATGVSAGIGGYYHLLDGKIRVAVRNLDPQDGRLRALLYHEYAHALIHAVAQGNNPPRWVHEGLAIHLEKQRAGGFRDAAVRQAQRGVIPSLEESPYVQGSVAMEYLIERHGMTAVQALLRRLGEGQAFAEAFQAVYGLSVAAFEDRLRGYLILGY